MQNAEFRVSVLGCSSVRVSVRVRLRLGSGHSLAMVKLRGSQWRNGCSAVVIHL